MKLQRLNGLKLRALRKKAGISRTAAAFSIGRSAEMISAYERSAAMPSADVLARLCALYGCELDDVFDEVEDDQDPAAELLRQARRDQGVPETITDPAVLDQAAAILRSGRRNRRPA